MIKMKKIISALISGMMLLSTVPSAVFADAGITVTTTDGNAAKVGNTLRAEVTNSVGNVTYQWWTSDDEVISGATSQEFAPTYEQLGMSIYCTASDEAGNTWESGNIAISSDFDKYKDTSYNNMIAVLLGEESTGFGDSDWDFEMVNRAGTTMKFSLLDVQNNASSKYYVLSNDYCTARGNNSTNNPEITSKYNPTQPGSVAYNANIGWTGKDNGTFSLPDAIVDAIDQNHVWITEKEYSGSNITEPYTFKAGVVVPAIWELVEYSDRVKIDIRKSHQITGKVHAWLRTAYNDAHYHGIQNYGVEGEDLVKLSGVTHNYYFKLTPMNISGSSGYVRTEFFLNENFFKNAKIELATAGSGVINEIAKLSYDDLSQIYTDEEISTYINAEMVTDERLSIEGELKIGNTLKAEVVNASDVYSYQWYADGVAIPGATSEELILTYAQFGKKISCTATGAKTLNKTAGTPTSTFDTYKNDALANYYVMYIGNKTGAGDSTWNFSTEDKSFTILDVDDNDQSTFFVIANDVYGGRTANAASSAWDPTETGTVAEFMNNELTPDGFSTRYLPQGIVDSIDENHVWITEKAFDGSIAAPYTFTAGVTAPAMWEMREYFDKITLDVRAENYVTGKNVYWFRTPYNANHYQGLTIPGSGTAFYALSSSGQNYIQTGGLHRLNTTALIRPVFYLNKDFFTKTKIDLTTAGSNIIDIMKTMYSARDLLKVYSRSELLAAGFEVGFSADVTWTDGTNEITSLAGKTTVAAEIGITSAEANAATADVIIALYDGDNKLVKLANKTVNLPAKQTVMETVSLTGLSGVTDEYSAKVFVWDSLDGMESLIDNAIEFETGILANTASIGTDTRSKVFFQ